MKLAAFGVSVKSVVGDNKKTASSGVLGENKRMMLGCICAHNDKSENRRFLMMGKN